ncbi:MAG: hypothetical protein AB7L66_00100 [Gemmatimonadales bacterium]
MTPPPETRPATPEHPLEEEVATGRRTTVRVDRFSVTDLAAVGEWDPSAGRLPLEYTIVDPAALIRGGRIAIYRCPAPEPEEEDDAPALAIGDELGDQLAPPAGEPADPPIATIQLEEGERTEGRHVLAGGRRWDGRLDDGARVSALDAPLWVRVEVWNPAGEEPPAAGAGSVARAEVLVPIAVVVTARWNRSAVIPADDPDEPAAGKASLRLEVKNIPEGTAVRALAARIGTVAQPGTDRVYEIGGRDDDAQPGLANLVVRHHKVTGGHGRDPEIVFSNYEEHWKYPGNNFYALYLSIGDGGRWLPVSQRNHVEHESDALHLRFTVFVHIGSADSEYRANAVREVGRFFNEDTKYFHAIVRTDPLRDPIQYHRRFRRRYIVIYQGHNFNECWHESHPRGANGFPIDHPHVGFDPDGLVCPDHYLDEAHQREDEEHSTAYSWPIGPGCGNAVPYRCTVVVGAGIMMTNKREGVRTDPDYIQVGRRGENRTLADPVTMAGEDAPRFMAQISGCRTALTEALLAWFNEQGTRFAHGWVYSVDTGVSADFTRDLYRRWIKETGSDQGLEEWEPERLVQVYRELAADPDNEYYHPRLRSISGRYHFSRSPDTGETALA